MILIALGANLGDPEAAFVAAQERMRARDIDVVSASSVWLSAPVPVSDQPWYRNAVISVETDLGPLCLLKALKEIEAEFGRVEAERNAPRVLDLDIIAYHDEIVDTADCIIPHPRAHERAFVLYPLQEIAPDWVHPVLGRSVATLIDALPEQKIEKIEQKVA